MDGSRCDVEERAGIRIVRVWGELDLYTASDFNRALAAGGAAGKRVVVDLSHCRYIDSAGFALLIRYQRTLGSRLTLGVDVQSPIRRIFRIAGLDDLLVAGDRVVDPDRVAGSPRAVAC